MLKRQDVRPLLLSLTFSAFPILFFPDDGFTQEAVPVPPAAEVSSAETVNRESYSRMAHPSIADRLGLDDEQRAKVQVIMAERAQQLAKAPKDQWNAVAAESEKRLEAVLTPAQQANWLKVLNEKTIRFIFKYQNWEDVLNWFADQVGMQLIMDAPPPGTLNYTDANEYTPTEALDKINGILQTKGFTLLRNDKMLILFDLRRNGGRIPPQYVPKIRPEDLPDRGTFEYVCVTFRLGRRDRAVVTEAFKPFEGIYCQTVPLPGNALLITDTAGTLKVIDKVITAIPEPEIPVPPPKPEPVPPAVWKTYTVERMPPQKVNDILKQTHPGIQTILMPNSNQIHVLAVPAQHAQIEQIIDRLDADPSVSVMPVVEVYSFSDVDENISWGRMYRTWRQTGVSPNPYLMEPEFIENLIETIRKMAPDAMPFYDKGIKKLIVFAVPNDQSAVKSLIEKIKSRPSAEEEPVLKIYKVTSVSRQLDQDITKAVQALIPKALVIFDRSKNRYFIVATSEEHTKIAQAFSELETGLMADDKQRVVCYPVTPVQVQRFERLFRQLAGTPEFDGAEQLADGRQNQLTIWATRAQHEEIRRILNELTGAGEENTGSEPGPSKIRTEAFVLKRVSVYSITYILPQIIPGITVVPEPLTNSVIANGTEEALADVRQFVEKLDSDLGLDIRVFPLNETLPDEARQTLQAGFSPSGRLIFDKDNMRLLAYGTARDLELTEKTVNALSVTNLQPERMIRVQIVKRDFPDQVVDFLKKNFPRADIQFDRDNRRFTVAASESDQLLCAKLISETELSLPPDEEIRFYTLEQAVSDKLTDLLKSEVKNLKDVQRDDRDPMVLRVKARPAMHEEVQKILERIKSDLPVAVTKELHTYPMSPTERKRFDAVKDDLFKEIGNVQLMTDDRQNMITVWALPVQHERMAAVLRSLQEVTPPELQDEIFTYSLKFTDSRTAQDLLQQIYPDVKCTDDTVNGRLIIRISKQFADAARTLLEQLDTPDPNQTRRFFATYPLGTVFTYDAFGNYTNPMVMIQQLQKLVPNAKVSYDYINAMVVVWGTREEQDIITQTVGNVHETDPAEKIGRFPLHRAEVSSILAALRRIFPTVIPSYDSAGKTIIAETVNPAQLKQVKALMEKLDPAEPGPNDPIVRFYQLNVEPAPYLLTALQRFAPTGQFVPDPDTHQLMVLARPAEHDLIKQNVEAIVSTFLPEEPMLFIYHVTADQRKRLDAFIATASQELKGLKVVKDETPGQVSIWAKPSEHQLIAGVLVQMQSAQGTGSELQLRSFSLTAVDQVTVEEALKAAIPEAKPIFDAKGSRLLVLATKTGMDKVAELLLQFDPNSTKNLRYMVYEIAVGEPEMVSDSIKQVYPNIKSTIDPRNKRIMIWATPEEHAAIAEMIEHVNKEADIPLQEKYVSYPTPRINYSTVTMMLKNLFPEADVYTDLYSRSVTVRALAKEHEQIKAILEQMQSTENPYYSQFAIFPLGNADPLTVESMLQGMFPDAESLTLPQVQDLLLPGNISPYQRDLVRNQRNLSRQYRQNNLMRRVPPGVSETFEKGCFKIDPQTKAVMLFLPEEDLKRASTAIESIVAMSQMNGSMSLKTYTITEGYYWNLEPFLLSAAPAARIHQADFSTFIAYATDSDHEKIGKIIEENNRHHREKGYTMLVYSLPDGCTVPRDTVIRTLIHMGDMWDIHPFAGLLPNQIFVFGKKSDQEKIQAALDQAVRMSKTDGEPEYKVYTLKYILASEAVAWLPKMVPNILIQSDALVTAPATRRLVICASPKDHERVAQALAMLDADLPEDAKPVPQEYNFAEYPRSAMGGCYRALTAAYSPAQAVITAVFDNNELIIWAAPRVHKEIKVYIDNYLAQKKDELPYIEFYTLEKSNMYKIQTILRYAAPEAVILQGVAPNQLAIYAKTKDQEKILELIARSENMSLPEGVGPFLKLYPLPAEKCLTMSQLLQPNLPGAIVIPVPSEGYLLVYATEEEHKYVSQMSEAVAEAFPEPVSRPYFTKHMPIGEAYLFLLRQFSARAVIYLRGDTGDLLVTASEEVHGLIRKAVNEIDVERPAESEKMAVAYDLSDLNPVLANYARVNMDTAVPGILILPSSLTQQWVIYAKPGDQLKVKKILDEMLAKRPEADMSMETYYLKKTTALLAWQQTIAGIIPNSSPGFGTDPHKLMIWAKKSDHEKIRNIVDKMNEETPDATVAKPYRFQKVALASAYQMISTQMPGTVISTDYGGNFLLITATPEEHETIEQIVASLDREDPATQISLKVHRTGDILAANLVQALSVLYAGNPSFQVHLDPNNNSLTALATPAQHEYIDSLITQIQSGGLSDPAREFRVYDFKNRSYYPVLSMLYNVFMERGLRFDVSLDYMNNRMIVRAKPEEHQLISQIVDSFREEEREMQVFTLQNVDPDSAQTAISQFFINESYSRRPMVRADIYSNQLYINGTREQLEKIRTLLIQMGEPGLAAAGMGTAAMPETATPRPVRSGGTMRTIPLQGSNGKELIEEIQRRWPQINSRKNPLVVPDSGKKETPPEKEETVPPQDSVPSSEESEKSRETAASFFSVAPTGFCAEQGLTGMEGPAMNETSEEQTTSQPPSASIEGAPVYITVNEEGSLNIASLDTDALDRLESLLTRPPEPENRIVFKGRDFAYYLIRNTAPTSLYQKLQQVMYYRLRPRTRQGYGYGFGSYDSSPAPAVNNVEIYPDDTTNTLFVRAPQALRKEIEQMIDMLDVADPVIEPVKVKINNTEPARVLQQVQRVYARQIATARLPGGTPIQLTIDPITNSIMIIAPEGLGNALAGYARQIDEETVTDESRKIHVYPLRKVNAAVVEFALTQLYQPSQMYNYNYPYAMPVMPYTPVMTYPAAAPYGGYNRSFGRAPGY
ncbi:MAG: hypothetical protein LBQ54_08325 [Planctomycetaceae bacterium]|nr:hypothetical protein [Planctomycetaceae bacterium]